MTPTRAFTAPTKKRRLALSVCAAAGILVGLLSVVPPGRGRRVAAVSRLGAGVRLLPPGLSVSFLPLERRVLLPREEGLAALDVPAEVPLPGGAALPVRLRLRLGGHGRLPIDAGTVRRAGWEAAWREWIGQLAVSDDERNRLLAGTALWRTIFPDDPPAAPVDLASRLGQRLLPLSLASAAVIPETADDVVRAAAAQELARRAPSRGRLILLGLDALEWGIVDDFGRTGVMPNLRALVARSAHAVLEVPKPLISPVVWTTIATGVSPETHGVLDFLEPDPAGGAPRPVTAASRKAPAIWEMAAAAGRSTATIGWWASYPAEAPPGGAVYSDRLTEQLLGLCAAVPRLADPPQAEATAHRLSVKAADVTVAMVAPLAAVSGEELARVQRNPADWEDPVGGLAKLVAATATIERLTDFELARGTTIVLSYLEGTDTVGHLFGPMMPPPLSWVDVEQARRFGRIVERYYAHVDAWIGRVLRELRPEDRLVIVSDHGFTWGDRRPNVQAGAHTATAVMWHHPEGAFLAYGRGIEPTSKRQRMHVLDVAPTLLALADMPAGTEMPGTIPAWLRLDAPTKRVAYAALAPRRAPAPVDLPPEAREEELAKLRALGYLAGSATPAPAPPGAPPAVPAPQFDRAEARRLNNLGSSRGEAGDVRGAEEAFRQAINADPTYAPSHYNLALLLRKQGRYDEADVAFWHSVDMGVRERETAVVQSALDYAARKEVARAKATFAEGRRRFPDAAAIWLNSGVFLGQLGEYEEATGCLRRAVELAPRNPLAHSNLATALFALGDRNGARLHLARAVELDPGNQQLRQQLASLGGPPGS